MEIKNLFGKLIKDPTTRRDIDTMMTGKIKIIAEHQIDEKGKMYEKLTPIGAITKEDIASFRQYNTTNIRKNIADNLYKFYKQKQKDLYKTYVTQIRQAINFYDGELNKLYGAGFAEQFISLKEKEDAFSKMKFFSLQTSEIGKGQLADLEKIKKNPDYEKNKKQYAERVKTLEAQYQMLKRVEFSSKKGTVEHKDFSEKFSNYREENMTVISLIEKMNEQNENTVYSMIEDSVGRLHELEDMIKSSGMPNAEKSAFSKKMADIKTKLSVSADNRDYKKIVTESLSSIDTMENLRKALNNQKEVIKKTKNPDIKALQLEIDKRRAAAGVKSGMDLKIAAGETVDQVEYENMSKLSNKGSITKAVNRIKKMKQDEEDVIVESMKAYDTMLKRIKEFQEVIAGKDMQSKTEQTDIRGESSKQDIEVVQVMEGNLKDTAAIVQSQLDLINRISTENDVLKNSEVNIKNASDIPKVESQLNTMNLVTGQIEGTIISPSEHIEQMMKEFGSYMLRIRLVQRGIQDITDAISEFQKVDDAAFQLGMVSNLNVGTIKAYRNEVLGLAADYRTTAEEIINTQSEVVKSGRTFDQAKQQVSASLILARSTFEDLNSASDVLNKLMLTLEISGSKSYETMSKLYNVVQNTPASLAGMEASMRQSSAAFSGLLDEIDYSGSQLEEYKGKLRDAELALVGFVNLQGKTPQMAGTAVKTLVDKMRAPTDKAVGQINLDLSKSNAMYEGESVTAATISRLAETDFNKGIDLLSKLYVNGNLTYKAIQDMFGPRNAATLSKLLYQVNGDLIGSSGDMLTKYDPAKDSKKLSQSWSQEMEELKNSFRALKGVANDFGDALLPLINVTGETVQAFAKFANENTGAKSTLQAGTAVYSTGKLVTNVALASYAMNQRSVSRAGVENQEFAVMGNMFRELVKNGKPLNENLKIMAKGMKETASAIWTVATSPMGLWIMGITAALAALTYAIKSNNEEIAKADQANTGISESFDKLKSSGQSYSSSLDSINKTMESLSPTTFRASSAIQILSQEIKSMLDMTMDYSGKLSIFNRNNQLRGQLKEIEQTISNKDTLSADREKAYVKKKMIEQTMRTGFSMKDIEKAKSTSEMYTKLKSYNEGGAEEKLASAKYILEKSNVSTKGISEERLREISENAKSLTAKKVLKSMIPFSGLTEDSLRYSKQEQAIYKALQKATTELGNNAKLVSEEKELNISDSKLLEESDATAEIFANYEDARAKDLESITSTLAKEAGQTQDINNYMNNLLKGKQASIFKSAGNSLSMENKLNFLFNDKSISDLFKPSEIQEKIANLTTEDAQQYIELASVIKKNRAVQQKKIDEYSYLNERKGVNGSRVIGTAKKITEITSKVSGLQEDGKSFEEKTGLSRSDISAIIKKSSGSKNAYINFRNAISANGQELTDAMNGSLLSVLGEYSKNMDEALSSGISLKSLGVGDINNLNQIMESMKEGGKLKASIEAQASILKNTTNNAVQSYLTDELHKQGVNVQDILSAKSAEKGMIDTKILEAANETQRAMNALILTYRNKVSEIATQLASAQNKMERMGVVGAVSNLQDVNKKKLAEWEAQQRADAVTAQASTTPPTPKDKLDYIKKKSSSTYNATSQELILASYTASQYENQAVYQASAGKPMLEEILVGFDAYIKPIIIERVKRNTDSAINVAKNYVNEAGETPAEYEKYMESIKKSNVPLYSTVSEIVKSYMLLRKSIRDGLSIDEADFRKAQQAIDQSSKNKKSIQSTAFTEGMTGAGASGGGIVKGVIESSSRMNTAVADAYEALKRKDESILPTEMTLKQIKLSNNYTPEEKSKMKAYVEAISLAREEEVRASSDLIEQMRKFKNELMTDIYKINRETGKGATSGEYNLETYFKNMEAISTAYSTIQSTVGDKTLKYKTTATGEKKLSKEGLTTEEFNKVKIALKGVATLQKANTAIETNLNGYIATLVQSQKEFGFQTSARNINLARESTQRNTPEGIFKQNEALQETRIGKANAWMNVYNDILSSASSIPSIQKKIYENQVIILSNTRDELQVKYDTLKNSADWAELEKVKIQLLMQETEKKKQSIQLEIDILERQKKLNSLLSERKELTGQRVVPEAKLEESLDVAYEQMRLSMLQLQAEEQMKDAVLLAIKNMGSLKNAVLEDAKATRESISGYIKPADGKEIDPNKTGAVSEEVEKADATMATSLKQRLIIEQYINDIYKARAEYVKDVDNKFGATIDNIDALITGSFDKIKAETPTLRKSITSLYANYTMSKTGDSESASKVGEGLLMGYTGDLSTIKDTLGDSLGKDFEKNNKGRLDFIAKYNKESDPKKKKEILGDSTEKDMYSSSKDLTEAITKKQKKDAEDKTKRSMLDATVAVVDTISKVIVAGKLAENQAVLEGLQFEEKILNARKSGYRTELAKKQIDEKIYENKMKQVEAQYELDKGTAGSQVGNVMSGIGSGLMAVNPLAGALVQVASPFISSIIGQIDGDARMKKAQAKADLASEKNYKEYADSWNLFYNTIKTLTSMTSQKVETLAMDYSKGRNLSRFTAGKASQEALNKSAIDSLNDFQGLGTLNEDYKTRTWYGKSKDKTVSTGMNYSFDNMSLDNMKAMAGMKASDLKAIMVSELQKDNASKVLGEDTSKNLGQVLGIAGQSFAGPIPIGAIAALLGGSKFQGANWEVLDSDVTDFQESLLGAIDAIEYLSREMNSLGDKVFYADKEGYGSTKQSDISAKYTELIANAKTAGNTGLATTLEAQQASEMEQFKTSGLSEIFYSTFSSIIMESAKKVSKDTGKFSTAYATAIGEAFGTQFGNIITEVINDSVLDNGAIDDFMIVFSNSLKNYTGNIADFIDSSGVLDLQGLSTGIGAGDFFGNLVNSAKELNNIQAVNLYKTSQNVSGQLRERGLTETQIGAFLESAKLIDPLKSAVAKLSDSFNPTRMSSANITMQRESFNASSGTALEELRRKKLAGSASAKDILDLKGLEIEDMKLSIKENVVSGFESGIKSAIKETKYSSVFAQFGSSIGEAISSGVLGKLDISSETSAISDLISSGDFANASMSISALSMKILKSNKENLDMMNRLRASGLDWTEIQALGITENVYAKVEDVLNSNSALSQTVAKYAKGMIEYNSIMVNEKYTNEEYYQELNKKIANGEKLSSLETAWSEQYIEGLDTIISKQSLINSLESNFQNILSNDSSISFLSSIGASIGDIFKQMVTSGLKANLVMESLVENVIGGKPINAQLAQLSQLFQTAKSQQLILKQQMIAQGSSYTMIETIFGADAGSRIADIYGEMKVYSNTLGELAGKQESYKAQLVSLNGVSFTYEEYYRELNLKKANGIALTQQEIEWTDKYSASIREFETNTEIVNTFYGAVANAFSKESSMEIFGEFASGFSQTLTDSITNGYLTNEFADDMASAVALAQQAISTGSVEDLYSAQQQLIAFSTEIETAKNQTQGLLDMFNSSKLIDFTDKTNDVQYSASSSKDITYNITQNLTLSAGNIVADGFDLVKLAKVLAPLLKPELNKL